MRLSRYRRAYNLHSDVATDGDGPFRSSIWPLMIGIVMISLLQMPTHRKLAVSGMSLLRTLLGVAKLGVFHEICDRKQACHILYPCYGIQHLLPREAIAAGDLDVTCMYLSG